MKTMILKWDYRIQLILGLFNLAGFVAFWYLAYIVLFFQAILGLYQLTSNGVHLLLQHKSLGFTDWRKVHFFGSIIYAALLTPLLLWGINSFNSFLFALLLLIIPQAILYGYIFLCKRELDFLEQREFHILK